MDWIFIWVYENVINRISYFKDLEKVCSHGQEEICFKMRKNSLVFFLRNFFSMWGKYSQSYFSSKLKVVTLEFLIKVDPQISIDPGKFGQINKRRPSNKRRP